MTRRKRRRIIAAIVLLTLIVSSEKENLQKASTLSVSAEPVTSSVSDNDEADASGGAGVGSPDDSRSERDEQGEAADGSEKDAEEADSDGDENGSQDGTEVGDSDGMQSDGEESGGTDGVRIGEDDGSMDNPEGVAVAPDDEGEAAEGEQTEEDGDPEELLEEEELDYAGDDDELGGDAHVPATLEDLQSTYPSPCEITIQNYKDWINLCTLSQATNLEGYSFKITSNNSPGRTAGTYYDFQKMRNKFTGIGSEEFPFAGKIVSYSQNNLTLKMDFQPIFNYLDGKATLENLKVECRSTRSGLADNLRGGGELSLTNVFIYGSISNTSSANQANPGYAGGLFGRIYNDDAATELAFKVSKGAMTGDGVSIGVTANDTRNTTKLTINGIYSGTIAGQVEGNVKFVYDPQTFAIKETTVTGSSTSGANGMIFGRMVAIDNKIPTFSIAGDTKLSPYVIGYGSNGGVIGYGENIIFDTAGNLLTVDGGTNTTNEDVHGQTQDGYGCGGVIGTLKNSEITDDTYITVQYMYVIDWNYHNTGGIFGVLDNCKIPKRKTEGKGWKVLNSRIWRGNVGCLAGRYSLKDYDNTLTYVESVNNDLGRYAHGAYAQGGIIGYLKFDMNKTLSVENWRVQGFYTRSNSYSVTSSGTGSVAGKAEGTAGGGTLKISDGKYIRTYDTSVARNFTGSSTEMYDYYGADGGMVGYCQDADVEMMRLNVDGMYLASYGYNGALLGYVSNKNRSQGYGHVYAEDISFTTNTITFNWANSNTISGFLFGAVSSKTLVKLAGSLDFSKVSWSYSYYYNQYIGMIAGVQEQALIYLEQDANYQYKSLTLDQIGNFGGVYRNKDWGDGHLLIENDKVQGNVTNTGGAYQLGTVADLLKLSIAFNSEGVFATNCFDSRSYEELLGASYVLTGTEYDMTQTGMVSMQRNLGKDATRTAPKPARFSGSFEGSSASQKAKIILPVGLYARQYYNTTSPQYYGQTNQGLFIYVGSDAAENPVSFANLELQADLKYLDPINRVHATNVGGLATFAEGSVNVENCDVTLNTQTTYYSTHYKGYYGGVFGRYDGKSASVLTVKNVNAGGEKTVNDKDMYTSQVIGYIECPDTVSELPKLTLEGITLSGELKVGRTNERWMAVGGLVAVINNSNATSDVSFDSPYTSYKKKAELSIKKVTVNGLSVIGNSVSTGGKSGALLGFRWTDAEIDMSDIKVTGTDANSNKVTGYRQFGGLITEVAGRVKAENISVDCLTVKGTDPAYPSLFISEGRYLYLTLKGYNVAKDKSGSVVVDVSGSFDEIVGVNQLAGSDYEQRGGVVSIDHSSGSGRYLQKDSYSSYVYQANYKGRDANSVTNPWTRYYYDLTDILTPLENGSEKLSDGIIESAAELMDWHLINYAVGPIQSMFVFEEGKTASELIAKSYTVKGVIDLNGYSYYPTSIKGSGFSGDENAKIIFDAQDMIEGEETSGSLRYSYDGERQHYLMQTGLFWDVAPGSSVNETSHGSDITIGNLTLNGTVSMFKSSTLMSVNTSSQTQVASVMGGSGGLIVGDIKGVSAPKEDKAHGYQYDTTAKTNIQSIILDNLWVAGVEMEKWDTDETDYYGLLVKHISSGAKVAFDKIQMKNYDGSSVTGNEHAASALIGLVGLKNGETNSQAIEISTTFEHMDLADVKDTTEVPGATKDLRNSKAADKVLALASLIYSYHYYEDTCEGVYTFYEADYLKGKGLNESDAEGRLNGRIYDYAQGESYVTIGEEIGSEVEFFDSDCNKKISAVSIYGCAPENYKPYVYTSTRKIAVNPKAADIDKGCGTYEDPYVIENERQLKSVYYYLKDKKEQLKNWKVNKFGTDISFCEKEHGSDELIAFGTADFPTKEQMNQAYYLIKGEIDFSGFEDFIGFGTKSDPFLGVLVGGTDDNGKPATIKLPAKTANNATLDGFALIRYAKGCVVRNLTVALGVDSDGEPIKVSGAGAGVMACIQGGDNVIDSVTVTGSLKIGTYQSGDQEKFHNASIGGYAGCVQLGSLIVRNMTASELKDFGVSNYQDSETNLWVGGAVGRVYDGVLVCDGINDTTAKVFDQSYWEGHTGIYDNKLEASPNFAMVNAGYLEENTKSKMPIGVVKVETDARNTKITMQPANDAQLWVAAMALNSGCFTYEGQKQEYVTGRYQSGYDQDSRCRNGDYSKVGNVSGSTDPAYTDVIKNDNLNGGQLDDGTFFQPYLFNFMVFDDDDSLKNLFTGEKEADKEYYESKTVRGVYHGATADRTTGVYANNFTIELTKTPDGSVTYDMTGFGDAFRGIGAGYYSTANYFKGNLKGRTSGTGDTKNTTLIEFNMIMNDEMERKNVGLINAAYIYTDGQNEACEVKDITVSGTLVNTSQHVTELNEDGEKKLQDEITGADAIMNRSVGGIMGALFMPDVDPSGYKERSNYIFDNVNAQKLIIRSAENAGGLVGKIEFNSTPNHLNSKVLFRNCQVGTIAENESAETYQVDIKATADVGGLTSGYRQKMNMEIDKCHVYSTNLENKGYSYFYYPYYSSTTWTRKYPVAGGLIGRTEPRVGQSPWTTYEVSLNVNNCGYQKLRVSSMGHMGGAVGYNRAIFTVSGFAGKDIRFNNTAEATNVTPVTTVDNIDAERFIGSFGGIVGYSITNTYNKTKFTDITIDGIKGTYAHGYYGSYGEDSTSIGGGGSYSHTETKTNMAGIAGALLRGGELTSCKVKGLIQMEVTTETTNTSDRVSAAGMVGRSEGLTCTDCEVDGENGSFMKATDSAAGFVAYYFGMGSSKRSYYKGCKVSGLELRGNTKLAGFEGTARYYNSSYYPYSVFEKVEVRNCTLRRLMYTTNLSFSSSDICSGGLIAYSDGLIVVQGNNETNYGARIKNVVTNGLPSYAAGGVAGYAYNTYSQLQGKQIDIENCALIGRYAGALAGIVSYNTSYRKLYGNLTVKNNKIIGFDYDTSVTDVYAGGLIGYGNYNSSSDALYVDTVSLEGNLIAAVHQDSYHARSYVGGLTGYMNRMMYIDNAEMKNNVISMLDYTVFKDKVDLTDNTMKPDTNNRKVKSDIADYMAKFSIWKDDKPASEGIKAIGAKLYQVNENKLVDYYAPMKETDLPNYAYHVGLLTGYRSTSYQSYILNLKVTYDDALKQYRPAVDVGSLNQSDTVNNLFDYRQYYHILYSGYGDYTSESESDVADNNDKVKSALKGVYSYDDSHTYSFGQTKKIVEDYQNIGDGKDKDARYNYHLGQNYKQQTGDDTFSIAAMYANTYRYYSATSDDYRYVSMFKDDKNDVIPITIFDISDLNKWINTYVNILTNSGGTLNQGCWSTGLVTVTPQKMQVKADGTVVKGEGKPSVKCNWASSSADGLEFTAESAGYDTYDEETNEGTFTVIHIEYKWSNPQNTLWSPSDSIAQFTNEHTVKIDIPIFVEEILEIDQHITGIEGTEYMVSEILEKSGGKLQDPNNSDEVVAGKVLTELELLQGIYTVYFEYDYNEAKSKHKETLEKVIKFVSIDGYEVEQIIPQGTKMTLVDIDHDSHAYYYTVDSEDNGIKRIRLSKFKDSDGVAYQEVPIDQIQVPDDRTDTLYEKHFQDEEPNGAGMLPSSEIAMQRYLLLIDSSDTDLSSGGSYSYMLKVDPDDTMESTERLLKRSLYPRGKDCLLKVSEIVGVKADFVDSNTKLEADKDTIGEDSDGLFIDFEFEINAEEEYWEHINKMGTLTSEYMDIAIYLTNKETGKRVLFPKKTQATFVRYDDNGQEIRSPMDIQDSAILYFYKDSGTAYSLADVRQNGTVSGKIEFTFDHADFSTFEEGEYYVYLELYKTKDSKYPLGGEKLGDRNLLVKVSTTRHLGFSLEALDLRTLGINGYRSEDDSTNSGVIDYNMYINFTDYIPKTENSYKEAFEKLKQMYFVVDYRILRKTEDEQEHKYVYKEPYSGDDIQVYYGASADHSGSSGKTVVYRFSEDIMRNGNRTDDDLGSVVAIPYTLEVGVKDLLEPQQNELITNYMLEAQVYILDEESVPEAVREKLTIPTEGYSYCIVDGTENMNIDSTTTEYQTLSDYFKFTIAKIKTDLNVTGTGR